VTERTLDVNLHPSLSDTHPVKGMLAIRGELSPENAGTVEEWHLHEHLFERVSTPGFLRGRRCLTPLDDTGRVAYLVIYEAQDVEVFTSPEYLARLDSPTPLTRNMVATSENGRRTAGRVRTSLGRGVGRIAILAEFGLDEDHAEAVFGALDTDVLPGLLRHREVLAARACKSEDAITAAKDSTAEGSRAKARTTGGGGFVLVDVTSQEAADGFVAELSAALQSQAGVRDAKVQTYEVQLAITAIDC